MPVSLNHMNDEQLDALKNLQTAVQELVDSVVSLWQAIEPHVREFVEVMVAVYRRLRPFLIEAGVIKPSQKPHCITLFPFPLYARKGRW